MKRKQQKDEPEQSGLLPMGEEGVSMNEVIARLRTILSTAKPGWAILLTREAESSTPASVDGVVSHARAGVRVWQLGFKNEEAMIDWVRSFNRLTVSGFSEAMLDTGTVRFKLDGETNEIPLGGLTWLTAMLQMGADLRELGVGRELWDMESRIEKYSEIGRTSSHVGPVGIAVRLVARLLAPALNKTRAGISDQAEEDREIDKSSGKAR